MKRSRDSQWQLEAYNHKENKDHLKETKINKYEAKNDDEE